jgi:hypothetical protein
MKGEIVNGSAISNDAFMGGRIFAASETTHLLTTDTISNCIYDYISVNISDYKKYPLTSEDFWFSGYKGPDIGEIVWESVHRMDCSPYKFNIWYVVESKKCGSRICLHNGDYPQ